MHLKPIRVRFSLSFNGQPGNIISEHVHLLHVTFKELQANNYGLEYDNTTEL